MKLKTTLLLTFFAITLIPFSVFGFLSMKTYNDQMEKLLVDDLKAVTTAQVEAVENFIYERHAGISDLAALPHLQEFIKAPNAGLSASMNEVLKASSLNNKYIVSVSVINRNAEVLSSTEPFVWKETSVLKEVKDQYLDGAIHFLPIGASVMDETEESVLVAIQGIFDENQLCGYIIEEISLSFFEKVRVAVNIFNDGTIYLTDGAGHIITAGSEDDSRQEYILSDKELRDYYKHWEMRDKSKQQDFLWYQAKGEQYLSYYAYVDEVEWRMITTVNVDQILQTQTNFWRLWLLLIVLLLFSSVLIHKIVSLKIGKPLDSLIQTFQKIKETSDYSLRMDDQKSREMNIISHEVNVLLTNVQNNMEKEKVKQQRLKKKASTDELTGLYNKRAINEIICSALDIASVEKKTVACFFIDVDDFKNFNTQYGHVGGDQVLCFVAQTLKAHFQFCGRIGGDEFLVCLADIVSAQGVSKLAKTLLDELEKGTILDGCKQPIPIPCSIGIALSKDGNYSCEELLMLADKAMYEVKNTSKNNFYVASLFGNEDILAKTTERTHPVIGNIFK